MKLTRVVLAVLMLPTVGVLTSSQTSAAAQKATSHPCSVTVGSQTTGGTPSQIVGDGAAYTNGIGGVSCDVGGPNSNNIVLNLIKSTRLITGYFTTPTTWLVNNAPNGDFYSNYLTIQQVANLGTSANPNTTMLTNAHYLFNSQTWSLNWCTGITESPCSSQGGGSSAVYVTRRVDGTWTVTTDSPGGAFAALYSYSSSKELAVYDMPFQLTIACPTCP